MPQQSFKTILARNVAGAAKNFIFAVKIPVGWQAEAVPEIDAINFYDPASEDNTSLEQSQIFIRNFRANSFLTLATVTIHSRENLTINNRPAVRYDIEKKPGVPNFPNQPSWRNRRHIVTDIRVSDKNPSVFYVIAKRPELDQKIYQQFLKDLAVDAPPQSLIEPVEQFRERITKKPFGIFVSPQNSPVQPERFTGYHTGVDVEFDDRAEEIPIRAIAEGEVILSERAAGYGGVLVIRHTIEKRTVLALYGHLDPATLPRTGKRVGAGDTIGILGKDKTEETDGERKHLHFAVLRGETVDRRGYVPTKAELSGWRDPLELFE